MNRKQMHQLLRAIETFDRAALAHGWHADQNGQTTAFKAKRLYKASKTRLTNLLKDVYVDDCAVASRPVVPGLDTLLSDEERNALRDEQTSRSELPAPPAAAVKELRRMGYSVAEWQYFDEWWVGYAHHDNPAICTISKVTGKAFIEVCKPHAHATVDLPFPRVD